MGLYKRIHGVDAPGTKPEPQPEVKPLKRDSFGQIVVDSPFVKRAQESQLPVKDMTNGR